MPPAWNSLLAVNLAIQEQLSANEVPTRRKTRRLARQYGALTSTPQGIDRALKIINFNELEALCSTPSTEMGTS